ncbi:MAG TPA: hypothetical protein VGC55_05305 [Dokdonella sp.]
MKKTTASHGVWLLAVVSNLAAALTPVATVVYAQFLDELKLRSAPNAIECGVAESKAAQDAALKCADQALARSQPFWFARRMQGIDSALWMGAASDGRGHSYRLYFDSDVHGGGDAHPKPSLDAFKCTDTDMRDVNWPPFPGKECKGIDLIAPLAQAPY